MTINGVPRHVASRAYSDAVASAGGAPFIVPLGAMSVEELVSRADGIVLTGGDDPRTEPFGVPTHPEARPIHDDRQSFETDLIAGLASAAPDKPVLGVCLGMQMMALCAGGELDQFMPETTPTHSDHWESEHVVKPTVDDATIRLDGAVRSKHRQAVRDAGSLRVIARAHDGVVEGIDDPRRAFYVGVQWHPERTSSEACGTSIFERFVEAVRNGSTPANR